MIEKAVQQFAKSIFMLFGTTLVLAIPMSIFGEPILASADKFSNSVPTADGWLVITGLVVFALALLYVLLYRVLPAAVGLAKAIREERSEVNGDMFP